MEAATANPLLAKDSDIEQSSRIYRAADGLQIPFGRGHTLVYSWHDSLPRLLPNSQLAVLTQCRRPATLADHLAECIKSPEGRTERRENIVSILENLRDQGLLVELSGVSLPAVRSTSPHNSAVIDTIAIATRNRLTSLQSCVTSYIRNCRAFDRTPRFVVADDSETPEDRRRCRELLADVARSQGARISYAGFEEKESFIRRLINTCDVPPDIARFGLLGIAGVPRRVGANRNTILLETTGKLFFSADDDTSASTAPSPSAAPGLKFTSSHDPAEIWFHPNRDMALASTAETSIDILRANEDLLGKSLAECCAETVPINTDELPPRMLRHIRSGNGRIALTLPGIAGDSGMGSPRWLGVKGATRERLLASHEMYETAFSSRNIVRATGSCTVSSGSFFMSYAAGFDNRELLPPFIPIQRNSDGVFGLTLRKCVENGYIAHLPWSVQHCPSEGRSWSKQELWDSFSTCRVADILILCINSYDFWPGMSDATNRLRMLGNYLEDLAGLSKNEFEEFLRIRMCQQLSRMVSEIEEQLRANQSKPEYWLADVEKYIECLRFAAVKSDIFAPADLKPLYGPEKAREFMHELVGQVGRLFRLWPHLIAAARELQTKEVNLAFQPSP